MKQKARYYIYNGSETDGPWETIAEARAAADGWAEDLGELDEMSILRVVQTATVEKKLKYDNVLAWAKGKK